MKNISLFFRVFIFILSCIFVCAVSSYLKKDYFAIDSINIKHFDSHTTDIVSENIGFGRGEYGNLPVYTVGGELAPKLSSCKLDSAGFVQELQYSYAFVSCHINGKKVLFWANVNENNFFRVGVFENMEKCLKQPHIFSSVLTFALALFIIFLIIRKLSFNRVFKICMAVSYYIFAIQLLLKYFSNSAFITLLTLFQFPVNLALLPLGLVDKYPVWYSILQFISMQSMYVLLYYGISKIKSKKIS